MVHGLETLQKLNEQAQQPLKELFGVFFMSEHMEIIGVHDQSIHIFESRKAAEDFVFRKLVEAELIEVSDDGKYLVDDSESESKAQAILDAQDTFYGMEFFHIYSAFDHRNAN
jgi:hypothetical protein